MLKLQVKKEMRLGQANTFPPQGNTGKTRTAPNVRFLLAPQPAVNYLEKKNCVRKIGLTEQALLTDAD
jgi:hypothetical protein